MMRLSEIDPHQWDGLPAEWNELESAASFLAFFRRQHGLKTVKAVLAQAVKDGDCNRQFLESAADDLDTVRLHELAGVVRHYAGQCADAWDMRFCPFPPDRPLDVQAWVRSQRRIIERRARRRGLLRSNTRQGIHN